MSPLLSAFAFLLVTVITSTLGSPIGIEEDKWLEALGLADRPGIYVGPGPVDQESSGDFASLLGGLHGSGDTQTEPVKKDGFDLTDILIAVDDGNDPVSFMPSSSSSLSSVSSSSIVEGSLSEYGDYDPKEDVHVEESVNDKYEGDNELGTGAIDAQDPNAFDGDNMPFHPNAIPDAFQHGANAELGPDTAINKVSTRAKANPNPNPNPNPKGIKPQPNMAGESDKSTAAGKGKTPPEVMKYTAVIGVIMVAVAVGMGALLSAIGLGAVRLIKRARKPKPQEA